MSHVDSGANEEFSVSLLDAVCVLETAWNKVLPTTIMNCFHKAGFTTEKDNVTEGVKQSETLDNTTGETSAADIEPLLARLYSEYAISAFDYVDIDMDVGTTEPLATENVPPSASSGAGTADWGGTESDDDCGDTQPRVLEKNAKATMKSIRLYLMQTSCTDSVAESFRVFAGELEKHMECQRNDPRSHPFLKKNVGKTTMGCDDMKPDERHNPDSEQKSPQMDMEGDSVHSYSFEGHTDEDDRFFQMCSSSSAEENTLLSDDLEENIEENTEEYCQDDTLLSNDLQENIEDDTEGYCQDHSLYTGSTEHSEGTGSENENPCDVKRSELFRQIQHELNRASFDKILCTSALYSDVVSKYKITGDAHFFEASQVDEDALTWFPKDSQPLTPLKIYGDGNCLPRCASMMAFGDQDNHVEMRTRIVMELALNLDTYLDDEFLKSGHECEDCLPTIYAIYVQWQSLQRQACVQKGTTRNAVQGDWRNFQTSVVYGKSTPLQVSYSGKFSPFTHCMEGLQCENISIAWLCLDCR